MKLVIDSAYCMNLDHRTDRWESVQEEMKKLPDVKLVRVPAILNVVTPHIGTRDTFIKVVSEAKERQDPYVLVIEDDLCILDENKVIEALQCVPEDWHLLTGGVYHFIEHSKANDDWTRLKDFCGLHFIIVRDIAYDAILALRGTGHFDRQIGSLVRAGKLILYCMHPMPCQQFEGYSDIQRRHVNHNARRLPWIGKSI